MPTTGDAHNRTALKTYSTREEADIFDHIERFCHSKQRCSTLGYLRPVEFEVNANEPKLASTELAAVSAAHEVLVERI